MKQLVVVLLMLMSLSTFAQNYVGKSYEQIFNCYLANDKFVNVPDIDTLGRFRALMFLEKIPSRRWYTYYFKEGICFKMAITTNEDISEFFEGNMPDLSDGKLFFQKSTYSKKLIWQQDTTEKILKRYIITDSNELDY